MFFIFIPYAIFFILGLTIGSFLNVCIYRMPENKSIVFPRSFCPNCNTLIRWHDNIPLLSYALLWGRCRTCGIRIPVRYPLVELLTGYIFIHLYYTFLQCRHESLCVYISYAFLCCSLIIATFIDIKSFIIPDKITFLGIPLAFILSFMCPDLHNASHTLRDFSFIGISRLDAVISSAIGMITGGGLMLLCIILGKLLLKKDAMGYGDVKLMCMIGGFVGWKLSVAIFFVAPFFSLLMAVPVLIFKKSHLIPYGPFLSLAALICILLQDYFIKWINLYVGIFKMVIAWFLYLA